MLCAPSISEEVPSVFCLQKLVLNCPFQIKDDEDVLLNVTDS